MNKKNTATDRPIQYTVTDPDAPIPYRVRVGTPSAELREFVVPRLGIQGLAAAPVAADRPSDIHLKVAKVA